MQEFFMDYGLWLLVALLVVIALVFLLSGKKNADVSAEPIAPITPAPVEAPPAPVAMPLMAEPAVVIPVEPAADATVTEPAAPEPVVEPTPAPAPIAKPEAAPVPVSPAITTPSAAGPAAEGDDLLRLKGVGPKLKALLIELGVARFDQIAAWTDSDLAVIDAKLGNFKGRPVRDHWIDQAKYLAAGDIAGFEAKYGKL